MAVRQPRVVQGLMHVRALKAVATYGMTLVLTEKVDEHDESSVVSAASTASPVPPLVFPASLSEPALLHARGRIGGRGGPLLKEPKKMKKRKNKKEQLIQRHILHHAAPNLSSLRFASKERQQASIALRDKLMKRPSRDELIRRRIIRPVAPSTSTTTTTTTATAAPSLKPGGQQQPQRVVTMLTSSSPAASTSGLRKSGTAAIDTRPTHAAAAAAASKKPEAQQPKSSKQAQAQKQKQILLPIDNSSRHHEYHGEQLSDLDRQEKKMNNRHKWFHGYVPYVKKREDEDVNDVPYYSLASSSGLGTLGGGKKKTPRRRKKNRRRCESMVQLPPELLLAFAEDDHDDLDLDRRRRVQRELYTLAAAKESESAEVVDISDPHGGGGGGVGLSVAGVGGLLGTSPGLGFEPHSPTLDRWEEMQVALGDRETVTSTPRRRPRGQLVKKNKSEREISFHQRSTDIDVPPQPPMQQLPGNNLKQSHLLHPHHGGAAAQSGARAGNGAPTALHVSSGRVKRHARSHSRDSKSSEALRHYHGHGHNAAAQQQPPPKPHSREDEYEPEESPEEEEEESSYDDEEEAESHIFGAWMGRRSGSHAR